MIFIAENCWLHPDLVRAITMCQIGDGEQTLVNIIYQGPEEELREFHEVLTHVHATKMVERLLGERL